MKRTKMINIIYGLIALIGLVTRIMAATKHTKIMYIQDLDDMNCKAGDTAFTMTSVTLIVCLARCTSDANCQSGFYRHSDRQYTGCKNYYTEASDLVADPRTRYFILLDPACNKPARQFRLCDGNGSGQAHPTQGRIEIYYNHTWWAVCNDCWGSDVYCPGADHVHNLNTICGTFGLSGGAIYPDDFFGTNTKSFMVDNLECTKTEDTILDCKHIGLPTASTSCVPREAVGVSCY